MKYLITLLLISVIFIGCGKEKTDTETKKGDSTANTKKTEIETKLEKENQELKEKLKQQEKDKVEEEKIIDKNTDGPSDEVAIKDLTKVLKSFGKGAGFDGVDIIDLKIVGKVPKNDRIVVQATAHIFIKVSGNINAKAYKQERKYKIEAFYEKFGGEWEYKDKKIEATLSRDVGRF